MFRLNFEPPLNYKLNLKMESVSDQNPDSVFVIQGKKIDEIPVTETELCLSHLKYLLT